jgi:DNA-binding CsgD family transcriptional regulator
LVRRPVSLWGAAMPRRSPPADAGRLDSVPPLPLAPEHWAAIVNVMGLAPQEARSAELVLRGLGYKQIAAALGIEPPTIRTYLSRVEAKTRTHGRMELAMHVLALSHKIPAPTPAKRRHK